MYKMFARFTVREHIPTCCISTCCTDSPPIVFWNVAPRNVLRLKFIAKERDYAHFIRFLKFQEYGILKLVVEFIHPVTNKKSYKTIAHLAPVTASERLNLPTWNPTDYPPLD